MIHLRRLPRPRILTEKGEEWTRRYLERLKTDPRRRPESKEYAHQEIKATLAAMSHGKCFYCEEKLSESDYSVDHYVEIIEDASKAFEWENLYLCCGNCQYKHSEQAFPRKTCLDPCSAAIDPTEHLAFEEEVILPRRGSALGRQTIGKYRLDRDDLERRRVRRLKDFYKVLAHIEKQMRVERRDEYTEKERESLLRFGRPEGAFSLMFLDLLRDVGAAAE